MLYQSLCYRLQNSWNNEHKQVFSNLVSFIPRMHWHLCIWYMFPVETKIMPTMSAISPENPPKWRKFNKCMFNRNTTHHSDHKHLKATKSLDAPCNLWAMQTVYNLMEYQTVQLFRLNYERRVENAPGWCQICWIDFRHFSFARIN